MKDDILIRVAVEEDAVNLTEIAIRSKGHWGYSAEFMAGCLDELRVESADILSPTMNYFVATQNETVVGFCNLEAQTENSIELGAMFVDPSHIGKGIGKMLWQVSVAEAASLGAKKIMIQSDPFAEDFYLTMGAIRVGEKASGSIVGRFLPLLEFSVG